MISKIKVIILLSLLMYACQSDDGDYVSYDPDEITKEIATDIEMIYSDSAIIQFIIKSPQLIKYYDEQNVLVEEFPNGIDIAFYNREKKVISELHSKYAIRRSADGLLSLRDSVTYVNSTHDRLETNALTIDELNEKIYTRKFFRLVAGNGQDTTYGRGFEANSDFSRFEITKYLGKRKGIDITEP